MRLDLVKKPAPSQRKCVSAVGALLGACCVMLSFSVCAQQAGGPVVDVTGGALQGTLWPTGGGAVFKGIPYAAPPVDGRRWAAPAAVLPWKGVRPASDFGPDCIAADTNRKAVDLSEDCLFLNVWTPQWPVKAKLPVMMWIYGGGLFGGGSARGDDGESLARHGVVVVTINYRVGVLGLIGHPELTAASPHHASGNYAMLDQIAALKWIRANIARFGGDPGNVTVFGQSAGARFTTLLITSPLAKGLFRRGIADSGSPASGHRHLPTQSEMAQLGVVFAQTLHAPSVGAVAYLRGLPVSQIVDAMPEYLKRLNDAHLHFDQGTDGYVIPDNPDEVYRAAKEAPVPLIVGSNAQDGGASPPTLAEYYGRYPDLLRRALEVYGLSTAQGQAAPSGQALTDLTQTCPAVAMAAWHSRVAPTYQFFFTRSAPSHPPVHGAELAYLFGRSQIGLSDESVREFSDQMQQYWTNFAKTGDPNGPGLPTWPKYDAHGRGYLELGNDGPEQKNVLHGTECEIFIEKLNRDLRSVH